MAIRAAAFINIPVVVFAVIALILLAFLIGFYLWTNRRDLEKLKVKLNEPATNRNTRRMNKNP
jgi:hypothetical protein